MVKTRFHQVTLFATIFFMLLGMEKSLAFTAPDVTAKSAIVIEAKTGKILFEKNAEERRYPASTTKMMTLIVALENAKLDELVTTSANAANTEGSSLWLSQWETLKMLDMLYGIMLVSGNDATVAVAEHIAGSVERFAKMMTAKAHAIGAENTHFANSSGLPDPNHYTTAHDLARIAAYGYKNPIFTQIVSTQKKVIPWPGKEHDREIFNENRMLWLYEGGNGVKTGYTSAAGRCLVSGAQRNGMQLITVVLDSERMWDDSIALLDYGFKQVKPHTIFTQGDIMKTVRVSNGTGDSLKLVASEGLVVPVSPGDESDLKTSVEVSPKLEAPIVSGQKIGVVKTYYKNTEISSVDLLAGSTIERKSFFSLLWSSVWDIFSFFIHNFA